MSITKRKSDVIEPTTTTIDIPEKRLKIESDTSDILRLNDTNLTENDYQKVFHTLADKLINSHELVVNDEHFFRLCEIEFYFYQQDRHADTFAHRHPIQINPAIWYFHRQGTSVTASYKGGSYKGLDVTFSSINGSSYGGILIRSIENKQTGVVYEGCCLVVDALLKLCDSETIKELVETKLNNNLNVFNKNKYLYLRSTMSKTSEELIASPRVGLTLKVPSIDREKFLFRPYRFTPKDYYPSKMKMMILLSIAAEKYFQKPKSKFIDFANQISVQTNTRLSTVTANLKDLQRGYDVDTSKKTSPLVDYYKKNFTTSDLAQAYGVWLRTYRSN